MKKFQLWSEGYAMTGEHQPAVFEGEFEAETFMEAYMSLVRTRYGEDIPSYVNLVEPVIWGCRVFDNEVSARKSFG